MRNVKKIIDDSIGTIASRYDMSAGEIQAIFDLTSKDGYRCDYLSVASYFFRYGYEMGHRATVTGAYDEAVNHGMEIRKKAAGAKPAQSVSR
ncbi:hypothetical protein [Dialister sp.]|jgi:hypothetical protein|uniref:hypothetical protein n=1 Tax=Dialister sp. TaxID=1955814 RepID=UPI003A5C4D5A